jgi:hypothetical protein
MVEDHPSENIHKNVMPWTNLNEHDKNWPELSILSGRTIDMHLVHIIAKKAKFRVKNSAQTTFRFSSVSLVYFDLVTNRITNPDLKSVFRINIMVITIEKTLQLFTENIKTEI